MKIIQFSDWKKTPENGNIGNKWRVAASALAAIFLVVLYMMIFFFSGQDAEESGSLSHQVTEIIVEQVESIAKKAWTEEARDAIVSYWEHPVRKFAHFSEYAGMGCLVYLVLFPWVGSDKWKKRARKWNTVVIIWVFASAALDEWHQSFVSGRCSSIWDVLLDTSGGCFGLFVCLLVTGLILRMISKGSSQPSRRHSSSK